jgi:transcriptional regulator with XRE-family HTH domain
MNGPKHVLAVLRRILELNQQEMADLLGCSMPTIQAVEYGKLPLSQKLAAEIQQRTGVDLAWLLSNDISKPPVNHLGEPYTKELFETRQAFLKTKIYDSEGEGLAIRFQFSRLVGMLACASIGAIQNGKHSLFSYKCSKFLEEMEEEFGGDPERWPWAERPFIAGVRDIERVCEKDAKEALEAVWRSADAILRKRSPGVPPGSKAQGRRPA